MRSAMAIIKQREEEHHEQHYLVGELESMGLSTIRLNEFNDNHELRSLVQQLKEAFLKKYHRITRRRI
jgi:hypothetical protein